jgi:hypothetical protein
MTEPSRIDRLRAWWLRWEYVTPVLAVAVVAALFWVAATKILARKDPPKTIAAAMETVDPKAPAVASQPIALSDLCTAGHPPRDTFEAYKSGIVWGVAVTMLLFGGLLLVVQSSYLFLLALSRKHRWRTAGLVTCALYSALLLASYLIFRSPPLAAPEVNDVIARCIPKDLWTFPYINTLTAFGVMCAAISAATTLAGHGEVATSTSDTSPFMSKQLARLRWVLYLCGFVETFAVFEVASVYDLVQKTSGAAASDFASLSDGAVIAAAFSSSVFLFAIYVPAAWRLRLRAGDLDRSEPLERFQQIVALAAPVLSTIPITSSLGLFGLHQ